MIEIRGLTKQYGRVTGVKDLDLSVREGEIFGFLGPNGAGKTTTITTPSPCCATAPSRSGTCWFSEARPRRPASAR